MDSHERTAVRYAVDLLSLISIDPAVCHGQARIEGTRVPVSVILDNLDAGMTEQEILEECPTLPRDSVRAAMAFRGTLDGSCRG